MADKVIFCVMFCVRQDSIDSVRIFYSMLIHVSNISNVESQELIFVRGAEGRGADEGVDRGPIQGPIGGPRG